MKKKLVAEIVYLAAVLVLINVFVRNSRQDVSATTLNESGVVVQESGIGEAKQNDSEFVSNNLSDNNSAKNDEFNVGVGETGAEGEKKPEQNVDGVAPASTPIPYPTEEVKQITGKINGGVEIRNEDYEQYDNTKYAWWFVRRTDHSPSGSGEAFPIETYDAYYLDKTVTDEDKVVYLTFDCGYENGFTPGILDTLAEQDVKALFFVTKDFVVKNPEYVARMKEEGHLVGNHTVRHLSSPSLTPEELKEELDEVACTMYELTGYQMDPFFRPPMGEYSERTLKVTQDLGYSSIFWSIAYYDYDVNDQPGKEYVVDHFDTYHHNGTIILMHNTSKSNAEALEEVVEMLKEEGYRFGEVGT